MKYLLASLIFISIFACATKELAPQPGESCVNAHRTGGNFILEFDDEEEVRLLPKPAPSQAN